MQKMSPIEQPQMEGKQFFQLKSSFRKISQIGFGLARYFERSRKISRQTGREYAIYRNHSLNICDVSVCISLYNYGRYISTAVESFMRNQGPSVEIVIVNDGSTDDSLSIAKSFLKSGHDVTLIDKHANTGLVDTRNTGLKHCVGEKVFILDADNQIYHDCLSSHLQMFEAHPNMAACYAGIECFDEEGGFVRQVSNRAFDYTALKKANYIDAMAMFDRRTLLRLDGYDTEMAKVGIGWEDYELWLRIGSLGLEVGYIEQTLSRYLVKSDSMVEQTNRFHVHALKEYLNRKYDADIQ
jgi:glycosyltransferase involved in cell wall biosynthesis